MKLPLGFIIFCAIISGAWPSLAETVKLNSGQTISGKILKEDKKSILMDVGIDTPVTYFRDEIKEILADAPAGTPVLEDPRQHADALESQAVELIDAEKMDEGMDLLRQAVTLDPLPGRHMNYGSILFGNGVALFKKDQQEEGLKILRQAEQELNKAITGFDKQKDAAFLSQAYFLLGEMYSNAFADKPQAKTYYTQALTFFDHDGAKSALAK
jgi:tetratricopeptide (TPR) repeat protein